MGENIYLRIINDKYADDFVCILNNDYKLRKALESKGGPTDREEFMSIASQWQTKTNSKTFAIVLNDTAIGTISLSYINKENETAKIGYWIGSSYWNKGYTTKAFAQILKLAESMNIKFLTCSIKKENTASKAIWEKFNAEFQEDDERFYPKIRL